MKIKQFAAVIISICGLSVGIAKSVAVETKTPVLAQQSGKIEEFDRLFQEATVSQEVGKYNQSTPILESTFAISKTSDTREEAGVTEPDKVARDRGGNPDSDSTSGGGTRGARGGKCNPNDKKPFLVLIPAEQDPVATLASHPTFWLYIPRSGSINFVLKDYYESDKIIYETKFNVESKPGFISWQLPSSAPPLENFYNWEFTFDCGDNKQVIVDGIIFRDEANDSELGSAETVIDKIDIYQENSLLPESVNELVNLRRSNPNDPGIKDRFKILLGKWYDDLVDDPIQDCCEIGKK
ncbi:MAG: DUF928 domain-containing protein [Okeania sp. SIO2F4]|uniref:DUF928 domain-containing protein n=1 Tax=Okeania sp. SIO2F4 TaxID=2607790 RepID=UPI00142A5F64|nr:DUF928 domain-containing protein [Okeania sp. SIO2F4]NES03225.1 DUF928 domain-containing protein [Okeania sp. SIO2F4]